MSLNDTLQKYKDHIVTINSYISIAHQQNSTGNYIHNQDTIKFITTSAFLKMFIGWETLLEESFIKYMTGFPTINGRNITCYVSPIDETHAHKILIGTQKYVDWANHEIVKRLSQLYFENGDPFYAHISAINMELSDLRTIRNSTAHLSSTTQRSLDGLASRKLGRTISNIDVYDLIMAIDPSTLSGSQTILQNYQDILECAAINICR